MRGCVVNLVDPHPHTSIAHPARSWQKVLLRPASRFLGGGGEGGQWEGMCDGKVCVCVY